MSAPRLARAHRSRIFIVIFVIFLFTGLFAVYHTSQQQLDEIRQLEVTCAKELDNAKLMADGKNKRVMLTWLVLFLHSSCFLLFFFAQTHTHRIALSIEGFT